MKSKVAITDPGKAHIIGTCKMCGVEHSGPVFIAARIVDGDLEIAVGTFDGDCFHALEAASFNALLEEIEKEDGTSKGKR